jgi:hypothetical protein
LTNGETKDGAVMAFEVEEKAGKPILIPAWLSRDMDLAERRDNQNHPPLPTASFSQYRAARTASRPTAKVT